MSIYDEADSSQFSFGDGETDEGMTETMDSLLKPVAPAVQDETPISGLGDVGVITPLETLDSIPEDVDNATVGPVLKETGKSAGRSILQTIKSILGSYDLTKKEAEDLTSMGYEGFQAEQGTGSIAGQLTEAAINSEFLKANEEVLKDMSFMDQVLFAAPNMGIAAAISIATRKPKLGAAYMGIQIMGNQIENLTAEGVPLREATKAGFTNALVQYPLEQFGLSRATKLWRLKGAIANRVKDIMIASGSEGATEALQVLPERITDILAKDTDEATLNAIWDTLGDIETYKQMGLEGSIGAIFGFAIGAGGAVKSMTLKEASKTVTEKDLTDEPMLDEHEERKLEEKKVAELTQDEKVELAIERGKKAAQKSVKKLKKAKTDTTEKAKDLPPAPGVDPELQAKEDAAKLKAIKEVTEENKAKKLLQGSFSDLAAKANEIAGKQEGQGSANISDVIASKEDIAEVEAGLAKVKALQAQLEEAARMEADLEAEAEAIDKKPTTPDELAELPQEELNKIPTEERAKIMLGEDADPDTVKKLTEATEKLKAEAKAKEEKPTPKPPVRKVPAWKNIKKAGAYEDGELVGEVDLPEIKGKTLVNEEDQKKIEKAFKDLSDENPDADLVFVDNKGEVFSREQVTEQKGLSEEDIEAARVKLIEEREDAAGVAAEKKKAKTNKKLLKEIAGAKPLNKKQEGEFNELMKKARGAARRLSIAQNADYGDIANETAIEILKHVRKSPSKRSKNFSVKFAALNALNTIRARGMASRRAGQKGEVKTSQIREDKVTGDAGETALETAVDEAEQLGRDVKAGTPTQKAEEVRKVQTTESLAKAADLRGIPSEQDLIEREGERLGIEVKITNPAQTLANIAEAKKMARNDFKKKAEIKVFEDRVETLMPRGTVADMNIANKGKRLEIAKAKRKAQLAQAAAATKQPTHTPTKSTKVLESEKPGPRFTSKKKKMTKKQAEALRTIVAAKTAAGEIFNIRQQKDRANLGDTRVDAPDEMIGMKSAEFGKTGPGLDKSREELATETSRKRAGGLDPTAVKAGAVRLVTEKTPAGNNWRTKGAAENALMRKKKKDPEAYKKAKVKKIDGKKQWYIENVVPATEKMILPKPGGFKPVTATKKVSVAEAIETIDADRRRFDNELKEALEATEGTPERAEKLKRMQERVDKRYEEVQRVSRQNATKAEKRKLRAAQARAKAAKEALDFVLTDEGLFTEADQQAVLDATLEKEAAKRGLEKVEGEIKPEKIEKVESEFPTTVLEEALKPLLNQKGELNIDLSETLKGVKATVKKSGKILKAAKDLIDVETPWKRMDAADVGFSVKTMASVRSVYENQAANTATNITKAVHQAFPKAEGVEFKELMADVVLGAERQKTFESWDSDKQFKLQRPVAMLRDYFDEALQEYSDNNITDINFYENAISKFRGKMAKMKDINEMNKLVRKLGELEEFKFVHLPKEMWFPRNVTKAHTKHQREMIRRKASFDVLVEKLKRHATSMHDLLRNPHVEKQDLDPVTMLLNYGAHRGRDMALVRIRDAAVKEGFIREGKSKPPSMNTIKKEIVKANEKLINVTNKSARTRIENGIKKKEAQMKALAKVYNTTEDVNWEKMSSQEFGVFKNMWLDSRLIGALNNALTIDDQQSLYDKAVSITKMMQFYNPLFMPMYDLHQALFMGGQALHPIKFVKNLAKGWKDVTTFSDEHRTAGMWGTFSQPFSNPLGKLKDQADMIKRSRIGNPTLDAVYSNAEKLAESALNLRPAQFMKTMYNASWNTAWKLDAVVRQGTYNYLRESGLSERDSAQAAAKIHADYASIPARTRKTLNKVIFTPTFAISMAKVHTQMVNAALRTAMGFTPKSKVDQRLAWGAMTTAATLIGIDIAMRAAGYEPEKWGRSWTKEVETSEGTQTIRVTLASPINKTLKYIHWLNDYLIQPALGGQPARTAVLADFGRQLSYEGTPLLRTAAGLVNNRKPNGDHIWFNMDDGLVKAAKASLHLGKEIVGVFGAQLGAGSFERFSPDVKAELKAELNTLLRLNDAMGINFFASATSSRDKRFVRDLQGLDKAWKTDINKIFRRELPVDYEKLYENYEERVNRLLEEYQNE